MKVVIAGSRGILVPESILQQVVNHLKLNIDEVVSGGCPNSPDESGEIWAKNNNIALRIFYADWDTHGSAAGPMRNREMAEVADAGLVFWDGLSKGTKNMKDNLHRRKKPVYVINCATTETDRGPTTTFSYDGNIFTC